LAFFAGGALVILMTSMLADSAALASFTLAPPLAMLADPTTTAHLTVASDLVMLADTMPFALLAAITPLIVLTDFAASTTFFTATASFAVLANSISLRAAFSYLR